MSMVADQPVIKITEDLAIVKKDNPQDKEVSKTNEFTFVHNYLFGFQEQRGLSDDILDRFDTFLQNHDLVANVPSILKPEGPLGSLIPRSFQAEDLSVPLAATGNISMN